MLIYKILINFTLNHLFINTLLINSINFLFQISQNGLAFVNLVLIEYYPSLYSVFLVSQFILINFMLILLMLIHLM